MRRPCTSTTRADPTCSRGTCSPTARSPIAATVPREDSDVEEEPEPDVRRHGPEVALHRLAGQHLEGEDDRAGPCESNEVNARGSATMRYWIALSVAFIALVVN